MPSPEEKKSVKKDVTSSEDSAVQVGEETLDASVDASSSSDKGGGVVEDAVDDEDEDVDLVDGGTSGDDYTEEDDEDMSEDHDTLAPMVGDDKNRNRRFSNLSALSSWGSSDSSRQRRKRVSFGTDLNTGKIGGARAHQAVVSSIHNGEIVHTATTTSPSSNFPAHTAAPSQLDQPS